jgi:type VII secretion-associated serine protease mycosin
MQLAKRAVPAPRVDQSTVLVRFDPHARARLDSLAASGVRGADAVPGSDWIELETAPGDAGATLARLSADPAVAEVAPNYIRSAAVVPNDPAYGFQRDDLKPLHVEQAWGMQGVGFGSGQTIAIVDSGVDLDHPDLVGRLLPGKDFVGDDSVPQDVAGHGTAVAGVAAATADNGRGVAGVAGRAKILPVRVLNSEGDGTDADVAAGIIWATNHGADVINLSLGGPGSSPVLEDAVARAKSRDVLVVAASGNEGWWIPSYPAAIPGVVAVGATNKSGRAVWFSNRGWWVDVSAPGVDLTSTRLGSAESYATGYSGTSFSAPIVAGVAALARKRFPGQSQAEIAGKIRRGARDRGPHGVDPVYGFGVVDVRGAVGGSLPAPAPDFPSDGNEHNGTPARATDLGGPLPVSATGSLSPEGDEDWFRVSVAQSGSKKFKVVAHPLVDGFKVFDPIIEVYDTNGSRLEVADAPEVKATEQLSVVLGPGDYLVRVTGFFSSRSPGTYELDVTSGSVVQAPQPPYDASRILDTVPADRVRNLPGTTVPKVRFWGEIDPVSVTSTSVRLVNGRTGASRAANRVFDDATETVTITPMSPLGNDPYVVRIEGVLDEVTGDPLPDSWFRFTVGPPP